MAKKSDAPTPAKAPVTDLAEEQKKAAGQTDSQREIREYHEGEFQTHDPITGEKRDLDEPVPVARLDRGETIESIVPKKTK